MKKRLLIVVLLIFSFAISGCSLLGGTGNSNQKVLGELGIVHENGDYSMTQASCFGWVTSSQTHVGLSVPMAKRILDTQSVTITGVTNACIRTSDSGYVTGYQADLTQYLDFVQISNDGAVIIIWLKNPDGWRSDSGSILRNNTTIAGFADISYRITDK